MAEKLITAHHLLSNNVHYGPGEEVTGEMLVPRQLKDGTPKAEADWQHEVDTLLAQLRRDGTLKTEAELRPAQAISEKDREIEALRKELEQMKAQMGIPSTLGEGNPEPQESPKSDE